MALAHGLGGLLAAAGVIASFLYTGSAMATTAIGTLIPILLVTLVSRPPTRCTSRRGRLRLLRAVLLRHQRHHVRPRGAGVGRGDRQADDVLRPLPIVRGVLAPLLYRGVFERRNRAALAFYCATELPLVVAITTLATEEGHMRTSTAAGLVGAAMLSTLVFPFVAMALRSGALERETAVEPPNEDPPLSEGSVVPQPAA